jgi:hypothetical protein
MRTILLLLIVSCGSRLLAQQVVATAGGTLGNVNGSISFTIGEGVAQTLTKGDKTITQGFHQTTISVSMISELKDLDFSMYIFPNPASDMLTLKLTNGNAAGLQYLLFDINGMLISQKNMAGPETNISVGQLPEGFYFIKIQEGTKVLKTFKIIKQ